MAGAPISPLRDILETQLSQLSHEVERLFDETRHRARRDFADQLNQAVRRIRQAASLTELCATTVDAAAAHASGVALFRVGNGVARGETIRGVPETVVEIFHSLEIPLASAAALAGAFESRDPVIAITAASEVSPQMVALAGHPPDGRASIYPIVTADGVPALLYAWGAVEDSAIELLTQVAGANWPAPPPPPPPPLVNIEPAPTTSAWDRLSPEEQNVHLRAQRFARVQVAGMRLAEPEAVSGGRARGDLYGALRSRIDTAREAFRHTFFGQCSSMVDYLHLELTRTLAHDDPELLGKDYPGPMA